MQEKRFRNFTLGFTAFATLIMGMVSCDTKVDLNAPYMSVPVVFGLLDAELDTQWVKINRTWLGEGDQTLRYSLTHIWLYFPERCHDLAHQLAPKVLLKETISS